MIMMWTYVDIDIRVEHVTFGPSEVTSNPRLHKIPILNN